MRKKNKVPIYLELDAARGGGGRRVMKKNVVACHLDLDDDDDNCQRLTQTGCAVTLGIGRRGR